MSRFGVCSTCGARFEVAGARGPIPRFCVHCHPKPAGPPKTARVGNCQGCGSPLPAYSGKGRHLKYCAPQCRKLFLNYGGGRPASRDCYKCGAVIALNERRNGRMRPLYTRLCDSCYRVHRYSMTAQQVADRDGAVCKGCGEPVDLSISRKDDWASSPSVDHIMPVSHGGPSTDPDNLQLMHLACNVAKGARVPELQGVRNG